MSDTVEVPFGDNASETATLLLAAADELGLSADVVQTTGDSMFLVPQEVLDKAGAEDDAGVEEAPAEEAPAPAKKAPAKKAAKKAPAKKSDQ